MVSKVIHIIQRVIHNRRVRKRIDQIKADIEFLAMRSDLADEIKAEVILGLLRQRRSIEELDPFGE
jgi:hypothetical protein